jgi:thiol-disulfide isomerase/thioredoxin
MPAGRVLATLLAVILVAGCSRSPTPPDGPGVPSPFAACPPADAPAAVSDTSVPSVTLPCFTGGGPVALNQLGRPAIINLWASWCRPCRAELPALQAFASEAGDEVLVLGVVTDDVRDRAAATATELGVHFPAVFDAHLELLRATGRPGLPVTLVVGADGSVLATDISGSLTLEKFRTLAIDHLGYAP